MCRFMLRLPRRTLDSSSDPLIGPAATDMRAHMLDDFASRGMRVSLKEVGGAHDLTRLTIAALRHTLRYPRPLHGMAGIGHNPSIVVTMWPATSPTWVRHEKAREPS